MKVIGFASTNHDASLTLIEDGKIRACYVNERFSRDKYDIACRPFLAFDNLVKDFEIDLTDPNLHFAMACPAWTDDPFVEEILQHKSEINVYGHHEAHCAGAYLTSGFKEKTLVFSIDSTSSRNWFKEKLTRKDLNQRHKQEFKSNFGAFYSGKNGKLTLLEEINGVPTNITATYPQAINSLTTIWYTITSEGFGFTHKDEGKVMGMAPQGKFDKNLYQRLKMFADFDSVHASLFLQYVELLKKEGWFAEEQKRKDFAFTWQRLSEDVIIELIAYIKQKHPGHKKLVLAGGFFANVKANQKINEYLDFEEIYIMPAMSDDGLSIGAALLRSQELIPIENKRWDNVFLGKGYTNDEIFPLIKDLNFNIKPIDPEYIAKQLTEGKLVGVFRGREEYGPRALGNRTILCDPRKKENHQYINFKLNRNEIMPFTPMIMSEHINDVCYAYKSIRAAEFMTLCFTVKDHWLDKVPAVIQNDDKTCRAQIVFKERNEFSWDILNEFYNLTGVPALLNTSFNGHGEPIINTPEQAIKKFESGVVDILVLNNMMLEK